jgi:hypothetical protein
MGAGGSAGQVHAAAGIGAREYSRRSLTGEKENLTAGLIGADGQAGGPWVVAGSERCRPCEQLEDTPHLQFWPLRPLSPQAVWTSTSAFSEQRYLPVAGLNFISWHWALQSPQLAMLPRIFTEAPQRPQ